MEDVIADAFRSAGATEFGYPQFFWADDEPMAAFKAEVEVSALPQLTKMSRVDSWRTVQKFKVTGATEHSPCSLLLYNNHQPTSKKQKFGITRGLELCKAVLRDAIEDGVDQMGMLMGRVMPQIGGRYDGKEANRIVREELGR